MNFFKGLIRGLPQNFVACFRPVALLWYAIAAGLTYTLVMSGADWSYFEATRGVLLQSITLYALFVAVGVSVSIHWLSDAVAGVMVGALIGITVAQNMTKILKGGLKEGGLV